MSKLILNLLALTICLTIISSFNSYTIKHVEYDISKEENRFASFEEKFFDTQNLQAEAEIINLKKSQHEGKIFTDEEKQGLKFLSSHVHEEVDTCENRPNGKNSNFYYFLPVFKGKLMNEGDSQEFRSGCFRNNKYTLIKLSKEETIISLTSSNPKNIFCRDSYWITTSNIHSIQEIFTHGEHKITFKNLSQDDLDEIKVNGIKALAFCQGFFTSLHSLIMSAKLYIGGLGKNPDSKLPILRPEVPEYMVKQNLDFLANFANFHPKSRGQYGKMILDFDEKEIKSGDFVAIYRLDGLDPLIMFGSGSRTGHSAVACWIDGELYVLESQDGWYWPKRGIQRNKFKQWVQWAHNADFNVAILPLREEIRQKFDVEKAIKWFTGGIEGLNYGYHNFLFSWIDTAHENFNTNILQSETLLSVFSILEKVTKPTATTIIGEALNQRTKTKGLSIPQVTAEAARQGFSFEELLAQPEREEWKYSDGTNYVCSCFVAAFWKAGGLFDGLDILPNEFTPKDVYQLDFFDLEYKNKRPQACQEADPDLPYCQVVGKYQVLLDGYSTIKPYTHMNEKCPSVAPDFFRPSDC